MAQRLELIEVILPDRKPLAVRPVMESLIEGAEPQKFYYLEGLFLEGDTENQNGRKYPRNEISNAVNKLNEKIAQHGPIAGECDHPCLLDTATALTSSGWKSITAIHSGESVYSIDMDGVVSVNKVLQRFENDFSGNLIEFRGNSINTKVTPNHKMVVRNRYGKLSLMTAREIKDRIDANDPGIRKYSLVRQANVGLMSDIPKHVNIGGHDWDTNTLIQFMGWYLSEGHAGEYSNNYGRLTKTAGISQNQGINSDAIQSVLDNSPLQYRIESSVNEFGNARNIFVISTDADADFVSLLIDLGKSHEKHIPDWLMALMDAGNAELFIDTYILGDGRGDRHGVRCRSDLFSVSEKMIDDIAQLCGISGIPFRKHRYVETKDVLIGERVILAENKRPLWFLVLHKTNGVYLDDRFIQVNEVPYVGKVYCIEVENDHTFLALDNEYSFWTGNSGMSLNFDRLAVAITEMRIDGSNGVGRMRVVPAGLGLIVEGAIKAGIQVGVSSRGTGDVDQHGVVSDFDIVTIDVVLNPSAPNAYPTASLAESVAKYQGGIEAMTLANYVKYDPRAQVYLERKLETLFINLRDEVVWRK